MIRKTFPSRETLQAMPVFRLRNVDIVEKDEELLVQEILNSKIEKEIPVLSAAELYRGVPDITTKEEEDKWQKIIDERRAAAKKKMLNAAEINAEILKKPAESSAEPKVQEVPQEVPQETVSPKEKEEQTFMCGLHNPIRIFASGMALKVHQASHK